MRLIDSERDAHVHFLRALVRTPSPNPPGNTKEAIELVRSHLAERDIASSIIAPKEESPNLVAIVRGHVTNNEKPYNLVLNGHIDHFPVRDKGQWQRDPYSGDVEDGYIHGRGGVDMKAGTAASIIAFTYMQRFQKQLRGQCTLEVVSDEETGGKYGTKYLLEQDSDRETWKGDCVLNAEPSGLSSIRFGEKGTLRITFGVRTQGGHGAYVHRNEGAIRVAARLIDRLVSLEELGGEGMDSELHKYLQQRDVRDTADDIMGKGAANSMLKPTVNIGTIEGGAKVNMIPASCAFEVDIRLPIGLTADVVLRKIDDLLADIPEASYTVQTAASNPAAVSPRAHELVQVVQRNAMRTRVNMPVPIVSLGATDCKHFRYRGVPAYSHGPSPATMAEKDERVSVEEFLDCVKVHTLTAWNMLGGYV